MAHAEVNVHGQITLPSALRARHGISAGSTVCIEERGNEIVISKAAVIEDRLLRELAAIARKNGTTKEDVVKAVRRIGDKIYLEEAGG